MEVHYVVLAGRTNSQQWNTEQVYAPTESKISQVHLNTPRDNFVWRCLLSQLCCINLVWLFPPPWYVASRVQDTFVESLKHRLWFLSTCSVKIPSRRCPSSEIFRVSDVVNLSWSSEIGRWRCCAGVCCFTDRQVARQQGVCIPCLVPCSLCNGH